MKTELTSRKILSIGSMVAGALLLLAPAIGSTFAQTSFTYQNPGEAAFLNVTSNNPNSNFTIVGAGSNGTGYLVTLPIFGANSSLENYALLSSGYYISNATIVNGTDIISGLIYGANATGGSGYYLNATSVSGVLQAMSSVYLVTGSGNNDTVNLFNGYTPDIYSVVTPGSYVTVNIVTGAGSATYAVQVGSQGTVTITPSPSLVNATTTASTNVFNIVYGDSSY